MESTFSAHYAKISSHTLSPPPAHIPSARSALQSIFSFLINVQSAILEFETKDKQTIYCLIISYWTTLRSLNQHKLSNTLKDSNNTKSTNANESNFGIIKCWIVIDWQSGRYQRFGLRLVYRQSS
jgi:hypothetical protein